MSKWKAVSSWSYRCLLLGIFVVSLILKDWSATVLAVAFASFHLAYQLDPKKSHGIKIAQILLMCMAILLGIGYFYLKYRERTLLK